jgi:hypothetical protein
MTLPRIRIGRPQRIAALLLIFLLGECLWIINRQQLTQQDYDYARCGREMWEKPSPLAGYFTSCGNLQDGTFAYRLAGLPLTLDIAASRFADHFRKPKNRIYTGENNNTSLWEMRHELHSVLLLEHLPFALFAVWLGGGLWWVTRRLFGNEGGFLALAFYCVSPPVLRAATTPNNDILAAWGLYGVIYTAIGVAHAMQGPRRKWRPRIVLMMIALGLTACASIAAGIFGFVTACVLMLYLAERHRSEAFAVLGLALFAALGILLASYTFSPEAFGYLLRGGGARFWFGLLAPKIALLNIANAGALIAFAVAAIIYLGFRRSRYFGNTSALLIGLILLPVFTTQVVPIHVYRRSLGGCAGNALAAHISGAWRRAFINSGRAYICHVQADPRPSSPFVTYIAQFGAMRLSKYAAGRGTLEFVSGGRYGPTGA